jgi:DNA primase
MLFILAVGFSYGVLWFQARCFCVNSAMIPKETIARILDAADVADVVGAYVSLKKKGAYYLGLCPFHGEKTPSFTVTPSRGIYKCFGCGKAGNPVNFVMDMEKLTYPEALRFLAKKYGIEIKEEIPDAEQIAEEKTREGMLILNAWAQKLFTDQLLHHPDGKAIGLSYFIERGFGMPVIEKFQLGYSLEARDAFSKKALDEGQSKELLIKTGLSIEGERGLFDRFAARVMFPIHALSGRVIGFGGRILGSDKKTAKYLNSPESEVYHKGQVLYGIYQSRKAISAQDECFLVEGYTDVISLHQAGIENVVASSGTSLTTEQIKLIRRFTKNITILYDGDAAGIKASFRGIDMILQEGLNVKVLLFPDGEDPDSFSRKNPAAAVTRFIGENKTDFISFKTKLLLEDTRNDPVKKAEIIRSIVESISLIPDNITRALYTRECSRMMQMDEGMLIGEVNKIIRRKKEGPSDTPQQDVQTPEDLPAPKPEEDLKSFWENGIEVQEWELLRLMLNYGETEMHIPLLDDDGNHTVWNTVAANYIHNMINLSGLQFSGEEHQLIYREYCRWLEEQQIPESRVFTSHEHPGVAEKSVNMMMNQHSLSHNWEERYKVFIPDEKDQLKNLIDHTFHRLRLKHTMNELEHLSETLRDEKDEERINELMLKILVLDQEKAKIAAFLGWNLTR